MSSGNGRLFPSEYGCTDERELFDSIASEPAQLSGTKVAFYSLRRAKNRDPLYREPSSDGREWSFHGPYEMMATVEFQQGEQISTEVTEYGAQKESDAVVWIARSEMESADAPDPKVGDVLRFWDLDESRFSETQDKAQWDITRANKDGNVWSTETVLMWRIELHRRTKFLAFRKVDGDRV